MESDLAIERTPDGRRLVVSRHVDATPEAVWEVLTDTDQWPDWGPSVRDVESNVRFVQEGTTGRVQTVGGLWLPFEVTTCEAYRWGWRVARIPATGHRVEETDDGSRAMFEVPLLAAGYAPVCQRALARIATLVRQ